MEAGLIETDRAYWLQTVSPGTLPVTGRRKPPSNYSFFQDCNESFTAYKVAAHRHTTGNRSRHYLAMRPNPVKLTFVPHLLPVSRGITRQHVALR